MRDIQDIIVDELDKKQLDGLAKVEEDVEDKKSAMRAELETLEKSMDELREFC
jgi:hypothetical protein